MISVSIQGIQQNPQDTSNFYLAHIYQTIADPNTSNVPSSLPASPPPFSPPNYAVWVNALWFLSLVISLTCALLATLLQQWARRYLKITQSRYSPHKRARIRAFFAEGVEKSLLPWAVEILPSLLHISLFLFFAGLVVYLCNVNLTIFKLVLSWVSLCTALYGCITCIPIIRHGSPYYTPLSLLTWNIVTGIPFLVYRFLRWFNQSVRFRLQACFRYQDLEESYNKSLVRGMQKTAEEMALNSPSEIDTRAFMWTFDCLDEDHELEHFFSGLPDFRRSNVVNDPLPSLTEEEKWKLYGVLDGLLDRTLSSDLLPPPAKNRRALICAKAIDPEHTPDAFNTFDRILGKYRYSGPLATGIAKILRGWGSTMDQNDVSISYARVTISKIIATRQPHDDSWYNLASNELGVSETSLREFATHGDSLSLVVFIHVVRQQFIHFQKSLGYGFASDLVAASTFDIKDTSLELQHEFCALWNQIVNKARDGDDKSMAFLILRWIRNVYLTLHQDTDCSPTLFSASTGDNDDILSQPTSYPTCKVPGHRSELTPHVHNDEILTTLARAIPHDHNNPAFAPSLASPGPPLPVDETLTDSQPLDKQVSVVQRSTQPISQMTTESRRISTASLHPITACTLHGIMRLSASEPSTSGPPPRLNASDSPTDDLSVERTELSCAPSDDLNVRSSPSTPVLDDILPTGLLSLSRLASI